MANRKEKGFTLLELMLVMGLSGFLLLAWSSALVALWSDNARSMYRAQQAQHFYQFGLWLAYDLERARERGIYRWEMAANCILYGVDGVRLRDGMMQWRPQDSNCKSPGWISMYDPHGFRITQFEIVDQTPQPPLLRLGGTYDGINWQWRYRFRGPVVFE